MTTYLHCKSCGKIDEIDEYYPQHQCSCYKCLSDNVQFFDIEQEKESTLKYLFKKKPISDIKPNYKLAYLGLGIITSIYVYIILNIFV